MADPVLHSDHGRTSRCRSFGTEVDDIDLDRGQLHTRRSAWYGKLQTAKSEGSENVLPIPEALVSVLKEYRAQWKPNPENLLFVTRNGRPPSSNKVVEYHLWTLLGRARDPGSMHSAIRTRRSCSTPAPAPKSLSAKFVTPMHDARNLRAHRGRCTPPNGRKMASILEVNGGKVTAIN